VAWDVCVERRRRRSALISGCALSLALSFPPPSANAEELIQPPVCSAETAGKIPELAGLCEVTPLDEKRNKVKINLTAAAGPIQVGGYSVITENYNGTYLTPIVEAMPGDTVGARLTNLLPPRPRTCIHHLTEHEGSDEMICENPTNLHYFHGGIVTPNNSRPPVDASLGNGDNIYVHLKNGFDEMGKPHSFDFHVPIPGEGELDAMVLEGTGFIEHPSGLNWYHSHLHGISSDQVLGGMSGLLSVGDAKANVKAACKEDPSSKGKCLNDIEKDTTYLREHTDVRYVLLRDIPLRKISALPGEAKNATAEWAPQDRDYFPSENDTCVVYKRVGSELQADNGRKLRRGFCQRRKDSAWLFTLNGQRFPTITVKGGQNLLLRMGNLSANVAYWLELQNESDEDDILKLTILGLDGVVPAKPVRPDEAKAPILAVNYPDLLLMPASRAEIYVRNDVKIHSDPQVYVLRAKELNVGTDEWPEIQLAQIVLEPNVKPSEVGVALNAPISQRRFIAFGGVFAAKPPEPPPGCVRDLDSTKGEHRRVTFSQEQPEGSTAEWSILTEIVHPPGPGESREEEFLPSDTPEEITTIGPVPFESYELAKGGVDWEGKHHKHVCIRLDPGGHSHKQLWVLVNNTAALHNFHIHQMKFRLATPKDLYEHRMKLPERSHTCEGQSDCAHPDYKLYEKGPESGANSLEAEPIWHDTIPIPAGERVFLIMSYDAKEQVGRFVFHCHILKHEDEGLMAPIEVWSPSDVAVDR
jgi:FtsP/CotA-like multicopper oxidase with cupredoxin domain